jgi:hypothetical protein
VGHAAGELAHRLHLLSLSQSLAHGVAVTGSGRRHGVLPQVRLGAEPKKVAIIGKAGNGDTMAVGPTRPEGDARPIAAGRPEGDEQGVSASGSRRGTDRLPPSDVGQDQEAVGLAQGRRLFQGVQYRRGVGGGRRGTTEGEDQARNP